MSSEKHARKFATIIRYLEVFALLIASCCLWSFESISAKNSERAGCYLAVPDLGNARNCAAHAEPLAVFRGIYQREQPAQE
jgi:hypothetical protein